MEEQKNQIDEQVKFAQLIKELAETQATLAKIDAQLAIRAGKEQVKGVIDSTRASLEEQAKKFGANLKQIEENYRNGNANKKWILEEYEESLSEINQAYEAQMQDALEKKAQLEADEQDTMLEQKQNKVEMDEAENEFASQEKALKDEIINAIEDGDLETAQQKMSELQELTANNPVNSLKAYNEELQTRRTEIRKLIEDIEKEYDKFMEDRKAEIDKVTEDKNNKLATIPKQNIFQRVLGSMLNKFNGTRKFMKTVMGSLQSKVATIKEEDIPQIRKKVSERRQEFSEKVQNARVKIEEKVKGKVEEYALKLAQAQQRTMGTISNMRNAVVTYGKDARDFVVEKMETVAIYGMMAKDAIINSAKDKMETAAIYGMEAKDAIVNSRDAIAKGVRERKEAIIQGARRKKEAFVQGVMYARDTVVQGARDTRDAVVQGARDTRDAVVQGARDTRNAVVQGARDTRDAAQAGIEQVKNGVVTHVTSTVDKGKRTFKSVINKGYEAKMSLIQKAQNSLNVRQVEIARKMQMLNEGKVVQPQVRPQGMELG